MLRLMLDLMVVNDDQKLLKDAGQSDEVYEAERQLRYNRIVEFLKDVEMFFELDLEKDSNLGQQIKSQLKSI